MTMAVSEYVHASDAHPGDRSNLAPVPGTALQSLFPKSQQNMTPILRMLETSHVADMGEIFLFTK
jgi:hypothetical protein